MHILDWTACVFVVSVAFDWWFIERSVEFAVLIRFSFVCVGCSVAVAWLGSATARAYLSQKLVDQTIWRELVPASPSGGQVGAPCVAVVVVCIGSPSG